MCWYLRKAFDGFNKFFSSNLNFIYLSITIWAQSTILDSWSTTLAVVRSQAALMADDSTANWNFGLAGHFKGIIDLLLP